MRKLAYLMAVLLVTIGFPSFTGYGEEQKTADDPPKKVRDLMHKKLENSQKILEGIAINDFKLIAKHAEELIDLSKQVEWKVLKTPQYEIHSNQFRRRGGQRDAVLEGPPSVRRGLHWRAGGRHQRPGRAPPSQGLTQTSDGEGACVVGSNNSVNS